ncbi:helix-turn-helix domain-containing protein [Paenibacillus sp. ACRRY]|uniref:helix-turn-helix domain-containing protein n=1 Tax=Paenibacillus sp. ACRRY TaxID=2918208 RepID=UPI001EF481FE|nr:helix-turn-helix domain-containing protein [Paenibacillus sp. ACRRY]MCG7384664.1 AraC family transcriptional regulator [Paenibacillus sp. ACRRY]
MVVNNDKIQINTSQRAEKAPVHHSLISDHFIDLFPLFINIWEEGFHLREHDHAYWEIVYIKSGEGYHYIGGQVERITKGKLYIVPVGTSHILRPNDTSTKKKLIVYNLCIDPEFIATLKSWLKPYLEDYDILSMFTAPPLGYISLVDRNMNLNRWFEQIYWEYTEKRLGWETSMFGALMQLIINIVRLQKPEKTYASSLGSLCVGDVGMSEIVSFIDNHAYEPLTLEQLAEQRNISPRNFIRLFRKATGMGFSDYLQLKRIEQACHLLLETDQKISTIAALTGYRDIGHFRKVFRKLMNVTPSDYRRNA